MNPGNVGKLKRDSVGGTWYRALQPHFYRTALHTAHTAALPSRFNPGDGTFETLYLAETPDVALFEVGALLGSPFSGLGSLVVPAPRRSWIIAAVEVNLVDIVDLTMVEEQEKIDATAQHLTGDWLGYQKRIPSDSVSAPVGIAPTQQVAGALHQLNELEGFLAVSSKVPNRKTLIIFPDKVSHWSNVFFRNPITGTTNSLARGGIVPPV